ncbi:MAG: conserved rane protein of unknown function [Hyphomicrobiales bacterium]|nr:conserved rane protein of unknown function [Hyphomicrobiales bacterium]
MSQLDLAGTSSPTQGALGSVTGGLSVERTRSLQWTRIETICAILGLSLFSTFALSAWAWSGALVPWDSKNQFYPFFRFLAESLAHGDLPLWNPYHFAGHPSVADPQSLLFTPTMMLFALVAPKASMAAFDVVIFSHLFAGGLGMLGLFRRRGWHPAGALLAAMIFMLGGAASSRLQHTGIIISYAFFPLALLALEIALARRSWTYAVLFGLFGTLMVLGRDQVALLMGLALVGAAAFHVVRAEKPVSFLASRLPLLIVSGAIVIAALAVPSLLTMQFLAASNRPGIAYGVAAAGSLHPANFATFLTGDIFGSNDWNYRYWGPGYEATDMADFTDRTINYLFAGTLPALLILWHGFAGGRIFGRGLRYFAVLGTLATLYALGRYTPFFGLMFDHLPGISLYRRPADATFLLNIAIALTAGYLLHRYIAEGIPRPFRRLHRGLASALVAGTVGTIGLAIGSALAFASAKAQLIESLQAVAVCMGLATALAAVFFLADQGGPRRRALAAMLLVAFGGAELVTRNAASSQNAEPASQYAVYSGKTQPGRNGLDVLAQEIQAAHARGEYPRVEILGLNGPWQNASLVMGLENTLGYNPLRIADYARAIGPGENSGDPNLRQFPGTFRGYRCNLATLLGLEYLVLDRPLNRLPRHVPRPKATPIFAGRNMYIYRLGTPAPRAYLAMQVKAVDKETVLEESALPDFNRAREVLIDNESMSDLREIYALGDSDAMPSSSVKIRTHDGSRVAIDVESDRAGVLVLHDLYYPGWQVRVDGEVKPVLRANLLFRGVEVPAGHHNVVFEFKPFALTNLASIVTHMLSREEE